MATIILDSAAHNAITGTTQLLPQDGDIYILKSDAIGEFKFLGDADFEVRIEDAGPYSQSIGQVTLSFEDTTNPTVNYANGVDAERVWLNANGDSLTVNAGDNVTLGPIIGSGEERYSSMPSGDGLNADGGGLTVTTGSGTIVTKQIEGPSSGADANYTFGEGNEFWSNATVTGSVGGNTTIVVGDNAEVAAGAGFVAPRGELNGNTQSITIGNNVVHDPSFPPAWEVTVAGTDGEKTIDIGDNVTVAEVGFGTEGDVPLIDFDHDTTYVNPTGGTLTAGENLTVRYPVWGTEEGSTYILGDGWDVPFDLRGAGENNGDDPADQLILGAPKSDDGTTIEVMGSGNDLISIMPPEEPADERANLIGSLISEGWSANDDGSYSPTALTDPNGLYLVGPSNENADIQIAGFSGPALAPPGPNQIVDGENDAEFMGDGYDDANGPTNSGGDIIDGADGDNDVILGNGGNDNIIAGAGTDEVYGGSGNDVIDGGAGNDTLTGDFASDVTDTVVDNSTVEGDDILEGGAGNDVIYGDSGNSPSAGGEGVLGDTLGDGPGSTGGGYDRISAQSVYNGNHSFSTDAFYLGNDIPVLDDANRDAITGVSFSQDGVGTDRTFGLDELEFTGAQRSFVGLVTVQDSDVWGANDQFSSSISGGFQDTSVVSSGTADFTMNDGEVFEGIRVNFVRGPDGETYMMPDDGPSPDAFNAFKAMLANNTSGIKSFTIATGSGDDNGINPIEGNWADGQFFELTEGDGGDDTIIGGEGADQMFGEGGDDTFVVGSAAEGAGDVISGGFGPDETTDNDVLDLTGAGPVTINATADANDAGAQSGTVTFADGSTLTFEGIETIIQDPDNTAPVIDPIDDTSIDENATDPVFTPTATDPDGDPVTYSLTGDDADLFNIDPTTGEVTPIAPLDFETPTDANGDGVYDVTVVATDPEGLTDEEPVSITVGDVNEAPVIDPIDDTSIDENATAPVFTPTATDPDGDPVTYSLSGDDADLFNIDPTTGEVTPIAPLDFENPTDANGDGIYDITVVATDPEGLTDEEPVAITVDDVNEAPVAIDDRAGTDFNTPVTIDVLDNDTDAEGDTLTIVDATVPVDQGTVDIVGGQLFFTPADGFEGNATISYTVSDGDLTDTAEVVVTVGDNPADGVVDGAEDGEVMDPGYTDPQGDEIDGADGLDDTINGNGGDDDIDAGLGDDTVSGGEGDDTIDGNDGDDTIDGNEGEDTIAGGDGDDVIDGGDDDDGITGGDGSDSVLGGSGDDVIDTSGPTDVGGDIGLPDLGYPGVFPADPDPDNDKDTVDGGEGNDFITTGDDADVITGGTGSDTINGGIDSDTIDGGDDGDRIVGGEGADDILGGGGDDTIFAGNDPDAGLDEFNIEDDGTNPLGPDLNTENGKDTVSGGLGNDSIEGADDDDLLMGDEGNDTIDGGIDDDTIDGGADDDVLRGGQGDDSILGGTGDDLIDGGIGDDSLLGGDDQDTFTNVNAGDTVDGGEGGNDFDTLDLSGSAPTGGSLDVVLDPANAENGVVNYFDADGNAAGTLEFTNIENVIPCFTPGTLIATAKGERLVEELQAGDRIITRDNGFQEIAWVGQKQLTARELTRKTDLRPIFVKAGSLGNGLPERDMMLSPNHKVLFAEDQAELFFEEREVLVAAKHLVGKEGIHQVDVAQTTYIHFMFERHEVILSDGTWTESFHPGDFAINGIDEEARAEVLALFPELATDQGLRDYRLARTELKKHEARLLIG